MGSPPVPVLSEVEGLLVGKSNVTSKPALSNAEGTRDLPIIGILCFSQRLENLGFVSKNSSLEINGLKEIIDNKCQQKSKE